MKRRSLLGCILALSWSEFSLVDIVKLGTTEWAAALESALCKVAEMEPPPTLDELIAIFEALPDPVLTFNGMVTGYLKVPWREIIEEKFEHVSTEMAA